jgi:hypothetical protein
MILARNQEKIIMRIMRPKVRKVALFSLVIVMMISISGCDLVVKKGKKHKDNQQKERFHDRKW